MQKILIKRVGRNLKKNFPRYLALLFLIVVSLFTVLSYAVSGDTLIKESVAIAEEDNVEDGEFSTFIPLTDEEIKDVQRLGLNIEDNFYIDYMLEDESVLRVFNNRKDINLVHLVGDNGKYPTKENEIVIERRYGEVHEIEKGDCINIGGYNFTVTALGTTPDYEGPFKNMGDSSINSEIFGTAFVNEEGYNLLKESGKGNSAEEYLYSYTIENEKLTNKNIKEALKDIKIPNTKISKLTVFTEKKNNMRIGCSKNDAEIDKSSALFLGVVVMVLLSYIIAVFVTHEIEKDKEVIGTLYALGVTRKDLLFHYLQLSVIITFIGGVIGFLIGTSSWACKLMLKANTSYFSLPDLVMVKSPLLILYALIMPPFMAFLVNVIVISKKLNQPALSLIKNEVKSKNKIKEVRLTNYGKDDKKGFIKRFRLRQLIREARSALVVVLGIFFSYIILCMGLNCYVFCNNVKNKNKEDIAFKNMYTYKYLQNEDEIQGEGCYGKNFLKSINGYDFDVTLLGIKEDNSFFNLDLSNNDNEVSISDSVASKFKLEVGDTLTLRDEEEEKEYSFTVKEIIKYSPSFICFMDINQMRNLFDVKNGMCNVSLSNEDLDIPSNMLYNTISDKDIIKGSEIFLELMWSLIYTLLGTSSILFIFVMYLMMKVMIDRSSKNISLFRIFGYEAYEIKKLYLDGNFIVVAIGSLIALPLAKLIMDWAYPTFLVANIPSGIYISYPWFYYLLVYIATLVVYLIINNLLMIKIKKIKECDVLKNRE